MIVTTKDEKVNVLFQEWNDEEEIPGEPAILIQRYSDVIELQQLDNKILLNYHHVKELIAHLKKIMKP